MDKILSLYEINIFKEKYYVDPVKIANEKGIDVYLKDMANRSAEINYIKEIDKFEINDNSNTIERQRFSIAYELAHFELHKNKIKENGTIERDGKYSLNAEEEREADKKAIEILASEEKVKEYLIENGIDKKTIININILYNFMQVFGLSKPCAIIRLKDLGYYAGLNLLW